MDELIAICKNYLLDAESLLNIDVDAYAYSIWATNEIMRSIPLYPDLSPMGLICVLSDKFDRYSCVDPRTSFMFSVAKDVADYILDELLDERRNHD